MLHIVYLSIDPFNLVFDLRVQVLELLDVIFRSLPVATAIGFQERLDHLPEGVWISVHETVKHLLVFDESRVGFFVDPVVYLT